MPFEHACFISFSRGSGKDSQFADQFFKEFVDHLSVYDKNLSVFKFDQCEHRRKGDAWDWWIQRELCHSAMMFAVCAPNYFNGSPGCVSEFKGMQLLITSRSTALGDSQCNDWLVVLRLKDTVAMPALNPSYRVVDFLDCCASPEKVRRVHKHRQTVEKLADRVYRHWEWVHDEQRKAALEAANICTTFKLPPADPAAADPFPHAGAVR